MSRPGRIWQILVAHQSPEGADRGYRLPIPGSERRVCARCLGLYPTLLLVVVFESTVRYFESEWRWLVAFGLVTPAVIHWAGSMLMLSRGSNAMRTLTGVLAGVGMGVAFSDYFHDTSCGYFKALIITLVFLVALVWWVRPTPDQDRF